MRWIDAFSVVAVVVLILVAVPLAIAAARKRRPHGHLMIALCTGGATALLASLIIEVLHLAIGVTPRFYHGMLTGLGLGALIAVLILYLADRRFRS